MLISVACANDDHFVLTCTSVTDMLGIGGGAVEGGLGNDVTTTRKIPSPKQ